MTTNFEINILLIFLGYFFGSVPFAFLVGKIKGVNIRKEVVNGAIGASMTWRKVGGLYGVLVAVLDIGKGVLVVVLAEMVSGNPIVIVLAGLAAILGHNWSIYMQFTGGKGAATTGGELLYILPVEFLLSFFLISLPIIFIRKKKYLNLSFFKREVKTTNLFSGLFFGILFVISFLKNNFSVYTFSPLIFAFPMFLKDCEIKREKREKTNQI